VELDKMAVGEVLKIVADDPAAERDIKILVERTGHKLLKMRKEGDVFHFLIMKVK
jgi:TusA-related sulfurtransferase